ncbi:MAG: hypothetical protein PHU88_01510 [candidate division Zixibacteria bacterium]|nr:hypothetical protein [candidate division Zixibacteria bacterium]MDD5425131.1 hypothetical protein [candidate division Zixibacteria bacterium]
MKIAFDFVCDEAPLFARLAQRYSNDGYQVCGFTMGRRWKKYWNDFPRTYPLDVFFDQGFDIRKELERLEQQYGQYKPASFIAADRFLVKEKRARQAQALISTFYNVERALNKERPDFYFSTGIAYLYNLVTLAVCEKHKIPHLSFYSTRGDTPRFTLSLWRGGKWDLVDCEYKNLLEGTEYEPREYDEAAAYLHAFREHAQQPYYMKAAYQSLSLQTVFLKEFIIRLHNWYIGGWGREKGDYITQHPLWYAWRDIKKIVRAQWLMRFGRSIFDKIAPDDRYYIFPLHLQPEASTLVLSEWYVDQLNTIQNIARALPADRLLYVKEHKSALGRHSMKFYRAVKALYNVRLIAYDADPAALIRHSSGVIVLSSTMGWEALLLKKPVYVLGTVYYQDVKGAEKIYHFEELSKRLAADREAEKDSVVLDNDEEVIKFIMALNRGSFDGHFNVAKMEIKKQVLSESNIDTLYKGFNIILRGLYDRLVLVKKRDGMTIQD